MSRPLMRAVAEPACPRTASPDPRESFVPVTRLSELRGDGPFAASAAGVELVVARTRSGLRAYHGLCPHQGALLGEGELVDGELVCRNHRWRFDAVTGQRKGGNQCLQACPVRVDGDMLLADVSGVGVSRVAAGHRPPRRVEDLPGPRALPVIGNAHQIDLDRFHLVVEGWAAELGTPLAFRVGGRRVVAFASPEIADEVLRARPDRFRRPAKLAPIFDEMGIGGVFSAEGSAWRAQRRLAMGALSHRNLHGFFPTMRTVAERLRRRWARAAEAGGDTDIQDDLMRFTVDVTTNLVFGCDLDTLSQGDDVVQRRLAQVFPALNRRLNSLLPYWRFVRLPRDRRLDRALAELRPWLAGLIRDRRDRLAREPARAHAPSNFLDAMLTARDDEGRPFDDETIFGNAMTMLLAGEDTTANTLAWAVHHLCDAPDAVDVLRGEMRAAGVEVVPADLDQVNRLQQATAIAQETMRLRPVAPMLFLEGLDDEVVGGVAIPRGTIIALLCRPPVLDRARFDDPHEFRPDRWLEHPASLARAASAHIPFGSGPRICPGRTLALVEMRLVLATLYASFDVDRIGPASAVTERFSFVMSPQGLRVRLRARPGALGWC
jgi:cytochrome P450/nitrite reductase/ring-hydroxylating ferredoxin subunit